MTVIEQAQKIRADMNIIATTLTDEQGIELINLFEPWMLKSYVVGDRIRYGDKLYRCVQAHISQSDWMPNILPALWTVVSVEEWSQWVQPIGAQDAYNTGDKVTYNDKHWVSIIDANVWEPGVYGWTEQL